MAAASKKTTRPNTPTEQNKEDNSLVLYRLQQVENKVDALSDKLDNRENITKEDLMEFRAAILERFDAKNKMFEDDIAELKANKADKKDVDDLKSLVKAVATAFGTIITALVVYYLTTGRS